MAALLDQWAPSLRRVPVVVLISALLLGLWGVRMPGPIAVRCDRTAPGQVSCQATPPPPWAWLPSRPFELQDVAMTSELCDNNPRGGVRFCHRLTLLGLGQQATLAEVRTPLSATALRDQIQRFIAGEGGPQLIWSSSPLWLPGRTVAIAMLLAIATWALWDLRWPPIPPSPLALDGAEHQQQTPR